LATSPLVVGGSDVDETIVLSAGQMDAITAGAVTVGPIPAAFVVVDASATGTYANTATDARSGVALYDPAGLPAIVNTYATVTSGTAVAMGSGGSDNSYNTQVRTINQQPYPNAFGNTARSTMTVGNMQVTIESTVYFGGGVSYLLGGFFH
jgi:hypothetical protein